MLISLVPASARTDKLFNNSVFDAMPRGSVFINAGRGSTVNEADLMFALEKKQLRVAAIDVAQHVAGNRPQGAAALINRNLEALHTGKALENLVGRSTN